MQLESLAYNSIPFSAPSAIGTVEAVMMNVQQLWRLNENVEEKR